MQQQIAENLILVEGVVGKLAEEFVEPISVAERLRGSIHLLDFEVSCREIVARDHGPSHVYPKGWGAPH